MVFKPEDDHNKYIDALEKRVLMLKQVIKLKDHKIADMECAPVPDGGVNDDPATSRMALVPEEPDEKMIDAACKYLCNIDNICEEPYRQIARRVWKAMVEAS